jgi:outer membrane biosynthesis protein TonB
VLNLLYKLIVKMDRPRREPKVVPPKAVVVPKPKPKPKKAPKKAPVVVEPVVQPPQRPQYERFRLKTFIELTTLHDNKDEYSKLITDTIKKDE